MQRHAAQAASARRAASALLVVAALATTPALAGDRAMIEYLGFSADGRYFAFEEYGIQDGSGFPFASLYVVDLLTDTWVGGSPYRVIDQSEDTPLDEVRAEAFDRADATFKKLAISEPAYPIAVNGDGEEIGNGHSLTYGNPGYGLGTIEEPHDLELEPIPLSSSLDCAIIDDQVFGFALTRDGEDIHRDSGTLPSSRGCAMDYRIFAVVYPPQWLVAKSQGVVIVSVYPFGFEGPDRRFLAVPLGD